MITIRPFQDIVDVDKFAEFDEVRQRWIITQYVRIIFPREYELNNVVADAWSSYNTMILPPHIDIEAGYTWDGASGPAMDTPSLRLASLVHDIICTSVGGVKAVADYFTRHYIYYRIANVQQCPTWRAFMHLAVLVPFNWIYDLIKGNNKEGESE